MRLQRPIHSSTVRPAATATMRPEHLAPGHIAIVLALAALSVLAATTVRAQSTEVRDPVRGVTYYSTQISMDAKTELQERGGLFSESDLMTLGLSAFFFDESESVEEYVLWIRHDGPRRWFVGDIERPLQIRLDDRTIDPAPFHRSRAADSGNASPLVEKLEFALHPEGIAAIAQAAEASIVVTTLLGSVVKQLGPAEQAAIRQFAESVQRRHSETQATARQ